MQQQQYLQDRSQVMHRRHRQGRTHRRACTRAGLDRKRGRHQWWACVSSFSAVTSRMQATACTEPASTASQQETVSHHGRTDTGPAGRGRRHLTEVRDCGTTHRPPPKRARARPSGARPACGWTVTLAPRRLTLSGRPQSARRAHCRKVASRL